MAKRKQPSDTDKTIGAQADDIPLLTDIAPDPDLADGATAESATGQLDRPSTIEVISRVQAQNLEHGVYQKLRKDIDARITDAVRDRLMPEIGTALNSAVEHI